MYMTQPSQDTVAWSEETQADHPVTSEPVADRPYFQQQPMQLSLSQQLQMPGAAPVSAAEAANATDSGGSQPSRLLMKIKSRAAAEAIANAVPSPAASSKQANLLSLPSLPCKEPVNAALAPPQQFPAAMLEAAAKAASEAAAAGATTAATEAAEQAKQAVAAAVAAQAECKAMAAAATAAAADDKENQEATHTEVLEKMTGIVESCNSFNTSLAALQSVSNAHTTKLSTVESTCQMLLGLMHDLALQTEQVLTAFQTAQVSQPAVTVLRCLDNFTQTSPISMYHQGVQAEVTVMATDALPAPAQVCLLSLLMALHKCSPMMVQVMHKILHKLLVIQP